jgi:membrane-associated phospholipid phosphatase
MRSQLGPMYARRWGRWWGVAPLLLALVAPAGARDLRASAPAPRQVARVSLLTRDDLWLAAGASALVLAAARIDGAAREEALESRGRFSNGVASGAQLFGNVLEVAPAVGVAYAAGLALHRRGLSNASVRVGKAVLVSGLLAVALKRAVGRARPFQAAADADLLKPFSRFDSFPSGHTTTAFAAAAAIDQSTDARWVPWVAYPLAALVGWSRVHDDKHWISDVLAGAALGTWSGYKTGRLWSTGAPHRIRPLVSPLGSSVEVGAQIGF